MAKRKLGLAGLLLAGTFAFLTGVLGCRHKDDDPIIPIPPVNNPPVLEQPVDGNILENALYTKTINMTDADGDDLAPYFITAPSRATVNKTGPNTAEVSWTPDHSQSDTAHPFTLEVSDGKGGTDTKTWNVYATNVSNVVINVNECGSGNPGTPIPGINVSLDSETQTTDSTGICTFASKPTGSYAFVIQDPLGTFVTHKPKNLEVSRAEEDAGHLALEKRVVSEEHFQFIEDTARGPPGEPNRRVKKWGQKPRYEIYSQYTPAGIPVEGEKIDLVKYIILNRISGKFYDSSGNLLTFTDDDVDLIDSALPIEQPPNGVIRAYWSSNTSGGGNVTWFDGNNLSLIIAARARGPPDGLAENIWMQELSENMIGGGETTNDTYSDSVLYNGFLPTNNTIYSSHDNLWIDFHKHRLIGNKSNYPITLDLEDRDVNPPGTYINP